MTCQLQSTTVVVYDVYDIIADDLILGIKKHPHLEELCLIMKPMWGISHNLDVMFMLWRFNFGYYYKIGGI